MNDSINSDFNSERNVDYISIFFKYFYYRKYFIFSLIFFLFSAFLVLRYTSQIYSTSAIVKVLDEKENIIQLPTENFMNPKINLENEIQVIKSYPILNKVVKNQQLTLSVFEVGDIMKSRALNYPFKIIQKEDFTNTYNFIYENGKFVIEDINNDKSYKIENLNDLYNFNKLPFKIIDVDVESFSLNKNPVYVLSFMKEFDMTMILKNNVKVNAVGKQSDLISLGYESTNRKYSENIINELINVFNFDGIEDRRLIHKRTIEFVNNRFYSLSMELDSIETAKQVYQNDNDIYVSSSFNTNYELGVKSDEELFLLTNQISVLSYLLDSLQKRSFQLIPANLNLESTEINSLIFEYNENVLTRNKIILSAGKENYQLKQIENIIENLRVAIISSIKSYRKNLIDSKISLESRYNKIIEQVEDFPEYEKILRSIERNQKIKESLYLYLLQKREEAEVSFAVTEPSIKIVEDAISQNFPVYPNKKIIYSFAFILAFFVPFITLFFIFLMDNKVHTKDDIPSNLPLIGEIPEFLLSEDQKLFVDSDDRSIISESFRILVSNIKYMLDSNKKSNVLLVTSSIKGEGKTLVSLNASLAFASLSKRVLLVGSDLRNPQIHKYLGVDKNTNGLVNFLHDEKLSWKDYVLTPFEKNPTLDILLSGTLPPNPLSLINNGNFEKLINQAKKTYDIILIDSAPLLLVADTLSLSYLADATLYLVKCNHTDKEVGKYISKTVEEKKIDNVGIILNSVGNTASYKYQYGYKYGYSYKYSYNYGYGYGYSEDKD